MTKLFNPIFNWIIILILLSCNSRQKVENSFKYDIVQNPDNIFWDYKQMVSTAGLSQYRIWSGKVDVYNQLKMMKCRDSLIVTFFDKSNDTLVNNTIHSQYGDWDQSSNNIRAISQVIVANKDNQRLYTDTLYYDHGKEKIFSNSDIVFISDSDTLYGSSFISNSDLSDISIKQVKANIHVNKN